jgi:hypothetical protein
VPKLGTGRFVSEREARKRSGDGSGYGNGYGGGAAKDGEVFLLPMCETSVGMTHVDVDELMTSLKQTVACITCMKRWQREAFPHQPANGGKKGTNIADAECLRTAKADSRFSYEHLDPCSDSLKAKYLRQLLKDLPTGRARECKCKCVADGDAASQDAETKVLCADTDVHAFYGMSTPGVRCFYHKRIADLRRQATEKLSEFDAKLLNARRHLPSWAVATSRSTVSTEKIEFLVADPDDAIVVETIAHEFFRRRSGGANVAGNAYASGDDSGYEFKFARNHTLLKKPSSWRDASTWRTFLATGRVMAKPYRGILRAHPLVNLVSDPAQRAAVAAALPVATSKSRSHQHQVSRRSGGRSTAEVICLSDDDDDDDDDNEDDDDRYGSRSGYCTSDSERGDFDLDRFAPSPARGRAAQAYAPAASTTMIDLTLDDVDVGDDDNNGDDKKGGGDDAAPAVAAPAMLVEAVAAPAVAARAMLPLPAADDTDSPVVGAPVMLLLPAFNDAMPRAMLPIPAAVEDAVPRAMQPLLAANDVAAPIVAAPAMLPLPAVDDAMPPLESVNVVAIPPPVPLEDGAVHIHAVEAPAAVVAIAVIAPPPPLVDGVVHMHEVEAPVEHIKHCSNHKGKKKHGGKKKKQASGAFGGGNKVIAKRVKRKK